MSLKFDDLKSIANDVNKEIKTLRYLKEQFQQELGYRAIGKSLHSLAKNVNDALDERVVIGESDFINVKTSALIECLKHPSNEVRRLAARLLPENIADKIIFADDNDDVIYAAAGRASPRALATLLELNKTDELLFDIARNRLNEDVDLERAKRLKDVVDAGPIIEIGSFWYIATAKRLIEEYMHKIDSPTWITAIVKKTNSSMKATSGVEIDENKLRSEILKQIKEIDDEKLNANTIQESASIFSTMLKNLEIDDLMSENFNVGNLDIDNLFESLTIGDYIKNFESEYKVKYYDIQKSMFSKRGLDESMVTRRNTVSLPGIAYTPHMKAPTERDEKALDRYVESWNKKMMPLISEGMRLKWSMSVEHEGKISFNIGIR